jgi:capsular polysaccharide transport system ATP-binding protein
MIVFDSVSKVYPTRGGSKRVLEPTSFRIERGVALALCGANGAGKSTLLRMIAGVEHPTSGRIARTMSVSWPIGYASAFQSSLSGADNIRFIARIYGRSIDDMMADVEDFARLGPYLRMPINTYSAGMMARLAFGVSLAIAFDCYLVDEITAVGDLTFQDRCQRALLERREQGTLIMVSHSAEVLKDYCLTGATLIDGVLSFHDTVDEAIEIHHAHQHRIMAAI